MRARNDAGVFTVLVDGEPWTETASLENAGAEDKVFIVDHSTGAVRFGDGTHGQRPKSGAEIEVSFRQGVGEAGNVHVSLASPWPPEPCRYLVGIKGHAFQISVLDSAAENCSGEKRVRYFAGQLLTADDFQDDQQYHVRMRHLHNKVLHGPGIASGFELNTSNGSSSPSVAISPGFAIDREGHEIILHAPIKLPITDKQSPQYVTVEHTEKETDWVVSPHGGQKTASRIEDCLLARLVADSQERGAITIGRVLLGPSGWDVDRTFHPLKSR